MKKTTLIIYGIAVLVIAGSAIFLYARSYSPSVVATPTPSSTVAPTPSPAPLGSTYTNSDIGITFQYSKGYYVIEDPYDSRLEVQNLDHQITGVPDASYRDLEIQYDSVGTADESVTKGRPGVHESNITIKGAVIRFYTYPNPNNAAWTIGEAFWTTPKHSFSLAMLWNRVDGTTQTLGVQQADELTVMKEIIPTISVP